MPDCRRSQAIAFAGDPGRARTCDPQFRKLMLYPAELRDPRPAASPVPTRPAPDRTGPPMHEAPRQVYEMPTPERQARSLGRSLSPTAVYRDGPASPGSGRRTACRREGDLDNRAHPRMAARRDGSGRPHPADPVGRCFADDRVPQRRPDRRKARQGRLRSPARRPATPGIPRPTCAPTAPASDELPLLCAAAKVPLFR